MKRISKDQWLSKALEMFVKNGVDAVKIERLAKELGTSRSGFYWHFKNRQDLLQHMLDYWTDEFTGVVITNPELGKLAPKERLLRIMKMIRGEDLTRYDLAMSAWAYADPLARKAVDKVVRMRLDYIGAIFSELGYTGDELEMRTRVFVCYQSWQDTMFPDLREAKVKKLQKLRLKLLTE